MQAEKIEKAREVIAEKAEVQHRPPVAAGERRGCGSLRLLAKAHPQGGGDEKRQGEHHAQRDQRDRIGDVGVGEFDQDRPHREGEDADQRQGHAPGAIGSGGHGNRGRTTFSGDVG